jgi:hypothetical protein
MTNFPRERFGAGKRQGMPRESVDTLPQVALMEPATLSIADGAAIDQWQAALRRTFWSRDLPVVTFDLPHLSASHNRSMTARARELRHACGCASSGFLMTLAVVSLAIAHLASNSSASLPTISQALAAIGWILAAGATGKLGGIFWARVRLLQLARALRMAAALNSSTHTR